MSLKPFNALFLAACGAHAADQLALAALPLVAVFAFGAGPGMVGALVAAQGAAWLVASLPSGVLVDRLPRRLVLFASQLVAFVALGGATLAAAAELPWLLGGAAFIAATGIVLFVLGANSLVPQLAPADALPRANARIESARALFMLLGPAMAGLAAKHASPTLGFALASLAALIAAAFAFLLPGVATPSTGPRQPILAAIREGAAFLVAQPLLRGVALCAVSWNIAFFALLAVFVPYAADVLNLDADGVGLIQAAQGAGSICGALAATWVLQRVQPRIVLVGGPAMSFLTVLLLLAAPASPGLAIPIFAQLSIGFGPMLWLICQTSLRQLVTPPDFLGRVGATIQVAMYGVRPLGALLGGWAGATFGLQAALVMVAALFLLSSLMSLFSALGQLRAMPLRPATSQT